MHGQAQQDVSSYHLNLSSNPTQAATQRVIRAVYVHART